MDSETELENRFADLIPDWLEALKTMASQSEAFDLLNHGEGHAMLLLLKSDSGLSAGEMSQTRGLTTGRMANILRRLEEKSLVDRTVVPSNRRKAVITLTEEGHTYAADLSAHMKKRAVSVLEALGRDDAETLIRILRKLARAVRTDDASEAASLLAEQAPDASGQSAAASAASTAAAAVAVSESPSTAARNRKP